MLKWVCRGSMWPQLRRESGVDGQSPETMEEILMDIPPRGEPEINGENRLHYHR